MIPLSKLLLILGLIVLSCCQQQKNVPARVTNEKDVWKGTYDLTLQTDSTDIDFKIELITGTDSLVYGYMQSDFKSYDSPIALDSIASDSAYFHGYTNRLRLKKQDSVWKGKFTFLRKEYDVKMTKADTLVRESLVESKDFTPLQFDRDFPSVAWATPISEDRMYLTSEKDIYIAELDGNTWQTTKVEYNRTLWEFYSIGISADKQRLIGHGKPLTDSLPHQGGGDYYFLELKTPTEIGSISQFPNSINTDSYDIFPWMANDGDVILTTYGKVEGLEQTGRSDIYLAKLLEDGSYEVDVFDKDINTEEAEAGVFMDYDRRFIIFHKNNRKKGTPDQLYISTKQADGWSTPQKLSTPVNREFTWSYAGRIDPQGKYLYFNSGFRGKIQIYRIAVNELEELKPFFN
jgi:hypothetical protein